MMTQIQPTLVAGKRKRSSSTNIDMTPLVDLGFLLITFFIFTTTMAEKKATGLVMLQDGETAVASSKALTVILGDGNKVFAYAGRWEDAVSHQNIIQTNYSVTEGLGSLIRTKQKQLGDKKDNLVLIIKPLSTASYQNVIDALDEALINQVQRYMVVDASDAEKKLAGSL